MKSRIIFLLAVALQGLTQVSNNDHDENGLYLYDEDERYVNYDDNGQLLDQCALEVFKRRNQLLPKLKSSKDIIRYQLCKEKLIRQFEKCENEINENLKRYVVDLSDDTKKLVGILSKDKLEAIRKGQISFMNDVFPFTTDPYIESGLSKLIAHEAKSTLDQESLLDPSKGKYYIESKIRPMIESACNEVLQKIKPTIDIYDIFGNYRIGADKFDCNAVEWLTKARICRQVLENRSLIEIKSQQVYRDNYFDKHETEGKLYDEWRTLKRITFLKFDEAKIKTNQFHNSMKRMDQLFSRLNFLNLLDKSDIADWKLWNQLIDFSDLSETKCDKNFFRLSQRYRHDMSKNNLFFPFLTYFEQKLYEFCKQIIVEQLDQLANGLTTEQAKDIRQLGGETFAIEPEHMFHLTSKRAVRGILAYANSKSSINKLNERSSVDEIDHVLKASVDDTCSIVSGKLKDIMDLYKKLADKTQRFEEQDPTILYWSFRYKICGLIAYKEPRRIMIENIHKFLTDPNPINKNKSNDDIETTKQLIKYKFAGKKISKIIKVFRTC